MSNCTFAYTAPVFCILGYLEQGSQGAGFVFFFCRIRHLYEGASEIQRDSEHQDHLLTHSYQHIVRMWAWASELLRVCGAQHLTMQAGLGTAGLCLLLPALPKSRWSGTIWVTPLLWIWVRSTRTKLSSALFVLYPHYNEVWFLCRLAETQQSSVDLFQCCTAVTISLLGLSGNVATWKSHYVWHDQSW